MNTLSPKSDLKFGVTFTGRRWLESLFSELKQKPAAKKLALSEIGFVTMYEWVSAIAVIDRLMREGEFAIDLCGEHGHEIVSHEALSAGVTSANVTPYRLELSREVHRISSFLESLGTKAALASLSRSARATYPFVGYSPNYYSNNAGNATCLLQVSRIEEARHCTQFHDEQRINSWRLAMAEEFKNSPLLIHDEVWRVFCRELASNAVEHSGTAGFLGVRIVRRPLQSRWCKFAYPKEVQSLFSYMSEGFLELCISDLGKGIAKTLRDSYVKHTRNNKHSEADVIQFAFDQFGTSKTPEESWITQSHALARMLHIVSRFGGAVTVRSDRAEVLYATTGGEFDHADVGPLPTKTKLFAERIRGTHIQIVLPIYPNSTFEEVRRATTLADVMPRGFVSEPEHVHGHLVPVADALHQNPEMIGRESCSDLKTQCASLVAALRKRPRKESMVFDFSEVEWNEQQFETFVFLMEKFFADRLVLFVEIPPRLAAAVKQLEEQNPLVDLEQNSEGLIKGRIHSPILGFDRQGTAFLFGVVDREVEKSLLKIIDRPATKNELSIDCRRSVAALESVLDSVNPLFRRTGEKWSFAWTRQELQIETRRAMTRHFESVLSRNDVWRGRKARSHGDSGRETFLLAWEEKECWYDEFFESTRILSRSRLSDEVAQRLLFRLRRWLDKNSQDLNTIEVLACVNAPALLLANAIRKWWPTKQKPAIADFGYYVMHQTSPVPMLSVHASTYMIIQDVFHTGLVSNRLVQLLLDQGKDVVCKIAMGEFSPEVHDSQFCAIDDWKTSYLRRGQKDQVKIHYHSLVNLRLPRVRSRPTDSEFKYAHWVEPRTLRPLPLRQLQHTQSVDNRNDLQKHADDVFKQPILAAGHFIYGANHYTIAIDCQRALSGAVGANVVPWIADVCSGVRGDSRNAIWETQRGRELEGDVDAVLMPLHSQVHYLWPQVEQQLAAGGRRQPSWHLDATLFLGWGPSYRMPLQLERQIQFAVKRAIEFSKEPREQDKFADGLKILIIDDATITGRTLETILFAISRSVQSAYRKLKGTVDNDVSPIGWVRYFSVFNQLSHAKYQTWKNMKAFGEGPSVKFLFESFIHVYGIPVYSKDDCPACRRTQRLEQDLLRARFHGFEIAANWIQNQKSQLTPISVESPGFSQTSSTQLEEPIVLLRQSDQQPVEMTTADNAILRFNSLMYLSYPPVDVLRQLEIADAEIRSSKEEYRRFRGAIYEWCVRHWSRITATSSRDAFVECIQKEINHETPLVPYVLSCLSEIHNDKFVERLLGFLLYEYREAARREGEDGCDPDRTRAADYLEQALVVYLLSHSEAELDGTFVAFPGTGEQIGNDRAPLLDLVRQIGESGTDTTLNRFTTLHLNFTRPQRYPSPEWALRVLCENLFRGRDRTEEAADHLLLAKLLREVQRDPKKASTRSLLRSCVGLFHAAIEDLDQHTRFFSGTIDSEGRTYSSYLIPWCEGIMAWLAMCPDEPGYGRTNSLLKRLLIFIKIEGEFTNRFNDEFHQQLSVVAQRLNDRYLTYNESGRLDFQIDLPDKMRNLRILTLISRLLLFAENWTITPVQLSEATARSKSCIRFRYLDGSKIAVEFLTNFLPLDETNSRVMNGRNYLSAQKQLQSFGVGFDSRWIRPEDSDVDNGYLCSYSFTVPTGFNPGGLE